MRTLGLRVAHHRASCPGDSAVAERVFQPKHVDTKGQGLNDRLEARLGTDMFGLAASGLHSFLIGWQYLRTERFHMKIHHPDFSEQRPAIGHRGPLSHLVTWTGSPAVSAFAQALPTDPDSPPCPSHTCSLHPPPQLEGAALGVWDVHRAWSAVAQRRSRPPHRGLLYFCSTLTSTLCLCIKLPRLCSLGGETEAQRGEGVH